MNTDRWLSRPKTDVMTSPEIPEPNSVRTSSSRASKKQKQTTNIHIHVLIIKIKTQHLKIDGEGKDEHGFHIDISR